MSFQSINGEASSSDDYHYLFKFLIIGDANTGKSCIMKRFLEDKFATDSTHTIGVEFSSKFITLGDKILKLQIWDTAGQERFRSVTRSYYRGAAGALLVYDITNRDSYKSVMTWLTDAIYYASHQITVILVGNKTDLEQDRQVLFLEASQFAQENDLIFVETSAKNGDNIEEAFLKCAKIILSRLETGEIELDAMGPGIQVGKTQLRKIEEKEINEVKKLRIHECSQSCRSI